ncbi:hypothetical protein [Aliiroseovarius sp. Z3]|uniref:hypothetical protein n=1 Tax=Aliiroseovarius sp. Z3 TaxID=2811402 RepID=UPI0023B2C2B4|nr:hypothetical protein [Aliiroseovarius sp. Z3]
MDKKIKPIVESELPSQFIYDLGLYLQTCAHIETSVCSLICSTEGLIDGDKEHVLRFHQLRKLGVSDLIKQLRKSSKTLDPENSDLLSTLANWLGTYQTNRHIAAHGAFYVEQGSNVLRVIYSHKRKSHGEFIYESEETVVDRDLALQLIEDADRILRSVVGLDTAIQRGEVLLRK